MKIYFGYLRGMCSPCRCNFAIDNFWLLSVYTPKKNYVKKITKNSKSNFKKYITDI